MSVGYKERYRFGSLSDWPWKVALVASIFLGLFIASATSQDALVLLGAIAIIVLSVIQPLFALALALLAGPFGALENIIFGGVSIDSGQILLLLALTTWICRGLLQRQFNLPKISLRVPLLIYIGIALLSFLNAPDLYSGIKEVIKWIEILAVMLMVTDLGSQLYTKRWGTISTYNPYSIGIWFIVAMLLSAGTIQALIGIWQFALRGDGPEHFLVLDRFYRAYGTFEQPNPFGGYMNMSVLLALGVLIGLFMMFWLPGREQPHRGSFSIFILVALILFTVALATLLGLVFSWSRGAWMGFLAGLTVMAFLGPKRLSRGLFVLVFALMMIAIGARVGLLPPTVSERVSGFATDLAFDDIRGVDINDENYSVLERLAHWQTALDMARDEPLFGVGFGNYASVYSEYALINWPDPLGHAHNYYFNILAETGIAGLIAYGVLWGAIFHKTYKTLEREEWPVRGLLLGLLGIWVAFSVHHLVDKLYVNNIYIHLGVLLGLLQLCSLHADVRQQNINMLEVNRE